MTNIPIGLIIFIIVLIVALTILSIVFVMDKQNQSTFQQERIDLLDRRDIELKNRENNIIECEKCNFQLQHYKTIQKMILDLIISNQTPQPLQPPQTPQPQIQPQPQIYPQQMYYDKLCMSENIIKQNLNHS